MLLVIDDYGTYLKKKSNRFIITNQYKEFDTRCKREFSANKVSTILVHKGASITTDAINLAVNKNINIIYMDQIGNPIATTYSFDHERSATVWRDQVKAYDNGMGMYIATKIIEAKILNQYYLMRNLGKRRNSAELVNESELIKDNIKRISVKENMDRLRQPLMGVEGMASKKYFSILSLIIGQGYYSGKRTRRPPKDIFNALLSYGYGILMTEVQKACLIAGLNPYMGFIHADKVGKASLVLDIMEEFRQPVVDRTAISLVTKNIVNERDIDRGTDGCVYLNKSGKHKLVAAIMERFDKKVRYDNENRAISGIIGLQAKKMVQYFGDEKKIYIPFISGS
ncbi:CRISPR-associated endonuclease Cas1 [Methanosalsum natronophilum]|uniref:CRISPR-associated endonuclease Cas1 n=1 Tax=Methanosalsum natronophilum TaxID=768733 RepID=UPI002169CDCD|nr:CRISPR-associated endonuclease Cas1 [Methanosalsum natronophilum]MCS3924835.1 CRISPR-associated protein Cas1 [Methanosalsum natronophilum]